MKKIAFVIIGLVLMNLAKSQTINSEVISSGGDSYINTNYQLDWSIGECLTNTLQSGSYLLTQGFHQSNYEITAVKGLSNSEKNIIVYPNPTKDFISLYYKNFSANKNLETIFTITNVKGKILQTQKLNSNMKQINFAAYAHGIYFLTVKQKNQLIKSFKIIKK